MILIATAISAITTTPSAAEADDSIVVEPEGVTLPAPPEPEEITLERGPLPPAPIDGQCSPAANPQGTGCVTGINRVGGFLDDATLVASVTFAGAPTDPADPRSVYTGGQLIAINVDGELFSNGSPWKCLTCGIPTANRFGSNSFTSVDGLQPFPDGKRVLYASSILECEEPLLSDACTPANTRTFPIRWNRSPDGSGPGGSFREPRLHPDGVHLGWSATVTSGPKLDQFMYYGRFEFNPAPSTGLPSTPRYDLVDVNLMLDPDAPGLLEPDPDHPGEVLHNPLLPDVGEFRAWSRDGQWAAYVGYPTESNRIDMFRIHMQTGEVQRITRHAEYTDPMGFSHDGQWAIYADTRGSDRQMFVGGMPGIPPLNDLVTTSFVSSTRNEGQRRFFQPILIDVHGDRGDYQGQRLNTCNGDPDRTGQPGDLCDLSWNILADPVWSLDDTKVAYRETVVNGTSVEPGGRRTRLIVARMVERDPVEYSTPEPAPDEVPWAQPYTAGDPDPFRSSLVPDAGRYVLRGKFDGTAEVTIEHDATGRVVGYVSVSYDDFSQDGINVINGTEAVRRLPTSGLTTPELVWHSDLTLSGEHTGHKVTSPGGLRARIDLFQTRLFTTGSLSTTIDGTTYQQPPSEPLAPAPLAPMVSPATPGNTAGRVGDTVELTVAPVAGDAPTSYQWYQGVWPDASTPVGGNAATLTVPVTEVTAYWVRVTNATGSTDSRTAHIAATPSHRDDCKRGGWQNLSDETGRRFRNQGDCVSHVATHRHNTAARQL